MTHPWQAHTRKDLDGITHRPRSRANHVFVAPAARNKLGFSQAELCASMAMTNALSGLSAAAASSLAQAMSQLVTDHVDNDPPTPLRFLDSVARLADNARTFFSSCVGTGIADQYALALGYRFRCNSREFIPKGRAGDFLYDGPPVPTNSAVMGSLRASLNPTAFWRTVDQGYVAQVEPHIDQTYSSLTGQALTIVHGYAIGCAAQVPLVDAIGHVVETAPAGGGPIPPGISASDPHPTSAAIALGNYEGVATLMGDEVLLRAIQDARQGRELKNRGRSILTRPIMWRGELFYEFEDEAGASGTRPADADPYLYRMPRPRFALWAPIFRALHSNLRELPKVWTIPVVPESLRSNEVKDGGAVLPDGFALLPPWFEREALEYAAPVSAPLPPMIEEAPRDVFEKLKKKRTLDEYFDVELKG
jgi:hypothetical protein